MLIAKTGEWQPFTMRVDQAPFNDVRVRQAMRLIVDRRRWCEQVLVGQGRIANDMYSPFDPAYDSPLPQRHQDIAQAKSLLKAAGHDGLSVQLVTAPVFQGVVQAAEVFAQQAPAPASRVQAAQGRHQHLLRRQLPEVDRSPRTSGRRASTCPGRPGQPARLAVQRDPLGRPDVPVKLIGEARADARSGQARRRSCNRRSRSSTTRGGYIIPYFSNQIDAYSTKVTGFVQAKSGFPLGNYWFKNVGVHGLAGTGGTMP